MSNEKTAEQARQEIEAFEQSYKAERAVAAESSLLWRQKLRDEVSGTAETSLFGVLDVRLTRALRNKWESEARACPEHHEFLAAQDDYTAAKGCGDLPYADKRQKLAAARERITRAEVACRKFASKWCADNGVSVD